MRSATCWVILLLSAAAGVGTVFLLQPLRGDHTEASLPKPKAAICDGGIPEAPPRDWQVTVTLAGTTDPTQRADREIAVTPNGSAPPRISSMLNFERLRDPDPVGNLDLYKYQSAVSDPVADKLYRLTRRAILSNKVANSERGVRDGTTLSVRLDVGDTAIEISFRHNMRPHDEVLELIAAVDAELPEKHRIGRGDNAHGGDTVSATSPVPDPESAARESAASSVTPQQRVGSPFGSGDRSPTAMERAAQRGAATAARDLAAGSPVILYCGEPWSAGKPLVDEATELPVEVVAGCNISEEFIAEVAAYNAAIREWHGEKQRPVRND